MHFTNDIFHTCMPLCICHGCIMHHCCNQSCRVAKSHLVNIHAHILSRWFLCTTPHLSASYLTRPIFMVSTHSNQVNSKGLPHSMGVHAQFKHILQTTHSANTRNIMEVQHISLFPAVVTLFTALLRPWPNLSGKGRRNEAHTYPACMGVSWWPHI